MLMGWWIDFKAGKGEGKPDLSRVLFDPVVLRMKPTRSGRFGESIILSMQVQWSTVVVPRRHP